MFRNSRVCRLCLGEGRPIFPIFSSKDVAETSSVQMKIMELANVQVYAGDGLPCNVCEVCNILLDEYHTFKTQIEKSDVILRHQLSSSQTDPLSVDGKVEGSGSSVSAGGHGEFVKAETLIIKDEDIDEEHVERILRPTRKESNPSSLANTATNDDSAQGDDDDDEDNEVEDDDDDDDEGVDNDLGGDDDDDDDDMEMDEEETDPLAGDVTEPNIADKPAVISDENQQSNLLLLSGPLIVNSESQSAVTPTTTYVALPTNVPAAFVTVPSTSVKAPIPTATVTSDSTEKEIEKDEPGPSTSKSDSTNPGEGSSTSGDKVQVIEENLTHRNRAAIYIITTNRSSNLNFLKTEEKHSEAFGCEICGAVFETRSLYRKHKSGHNSISCNICNVTLSSTAKLKRHMTYIHEMNDFTYLSCEICGKSFKYSASLKYHMESIHLIESTSDEKIVCNICGKTFHNNTRLQTHLNNVHVDDKSLCEKCGSEFKTEYNLFRHIKIVHDEKRPEKVCRICGEMTSDMKSHLAIHSASGNIPCNVCGKIFSTLDKVRMHKKFSHNKPRNLMCEICGAAFKVGQNLRFHYAVHSDRRKFKCNDCGKSFKYKNVLRTHMRVHDESNLYVCKTCGKSFKWRGTFNRHTAKCTSGK